MGVAVAPPPSTLPFFSMPLRRRQVFLQLGFHYPGGFEVAAWVDGAPAGLLPEGGGSTRGRGSGGSAGGVAWAVAESGSTAEAGDWCTLAVRTDGEDLAGRLVTLRIHRAATAGAPTTATAAQ